MFDVRKLVCVLTCAALVSGVFGAGVQAAEEKRIAVVNIATVFSNYAKVKDVQDKLKKEFEPSQTALDAEERAINAELSKLQIDTRDPEDRTLFRSKLELEQRKFDFKDKVKKLYVDIEERRKKEMKSVLEDIKSAISAVGRKKNYDLVMRAPEFDDIFDPSKGTAKDKDDPSINASTLVQRFRENPVLYFAAGVDITTEVIDILNADFKARGGK